MSAETMRDEAVVAWTRDELIAICEAAVTPMGGWHNRDSASAHEGIGRAWVMLRAGAPFHVRTTPAYDGDRCVTDEHTIWLDISWRGFNAFEWGSEDGHNFDSDTFYLPTRKRLQEADGGDWY